MNSKKCFQEKIIFERIDFKPMISLNFLHYNNPDITINLLNHLNRLILKDLKIQVIIYDNGSDQGNELLIDYSRYTEFALIHIKCNKNLGFAMGHNRICKYSKAKYMMIAGNDLIFQNDFFNLLIKYVNFLEDKLDAFSPLMYYETQEQRILYSGGRFNKIHPFFSYHLTDRIQKIRPVDYIHGGCFIVKKSTFIKVGGFNNHLFLMEEETDFSLKLKRQPQSNELAVIPKLKVYHEVHGSMDSDVYCYYFTRNHLIFCLNYLSALGKIYQILIHIFLPLFYFSKGTSEKRFKNLKYSLIGFRDAILSWLLYRNQRFFVSDIVPNLKC